MKNYKIIHFGEEEITEVKLLENQVVDFINNNKKIIEMPDEAIQHSFSYYVKHGSHAWGLQIGCEFSVSPV